MLYSVFMITVPTPIGCCSRPAWTDSVSCRNSSHYSDHHRHVREYPGPRSRWGYRSPRLAWTDNILNFQNPLIWLQLEIHGVSFIDFTTISLHKMFKLTGNGENEIMTGTATQFQYHPVSNEYVLPLRNMHCHTQICIATPKYALPLRNMSCHSEICIATPKYALPLRNMHCHSEIFIATPKYALPLRNMHCHSEICIATPKKTPSTLKFYILTNSVVLHIKHSKWGWSDELHDWPKGQHGNGRRVKLKRSIIIVGPILTMSLSKSMIQKFLITTCNWKGFVDFKHTGISI